MQVDDDSRLETGSLQLNALTLYHFKGKKEVEMLTFHLGFRTLVCHAVVAATFISMGLAYSQTSVAQTSMAGVPEAQHPTMTITMVPASSLESRRVVIEMPSSIDASSLMISLNGKDVASEFTPTACSSGSGHCETATLTAAQGMHDGKNVLYAAGKSQETGVVSSRMRFAGVESSKALGAQAVKARGMLNASSNANPLPTGSNFLPPTVAFSTLGSGGVSAGQPWIQLGDQVQIPTASGCSSIYSVIVLDRQTLQQVTTAPESSPQCIGDGPTLKTYLQKLTAQDLVIVGTNLFSNSDAGSQPKQLDTTPIGGRVYNCDPTTTACKTVAGATADIPLGYVAIGAGGATPGTAFENYYTGKDATVTVPNLSGMLEEDPWGNYNYQPAGAVEYTVSPAPQSGGGTASATVSQLFGSTYAGNQGVLEAPATGGSGGYWLIKLDRESLVPAKFAGVTAGSGTATFTGVGNFYPTANSNTQASTQAFTDLANDLNSTTRDQLVMLTTIGTPVIGTSEQSAAWISWGTTAAYYQNFAPAFEAFGAPAVSTLYLYGSTDAMSLVSCTMCGNAVTGNAVYSATKNSQQGQTGFVHGLLQPDMHGMYWPVRTDQISPGGSTVDYSLNKILASQPSEWPELSGNLMSGASTVTGQMAAYHYLSYMLVTQHYIIGAQGNYLDDIHYYFAGSNNTFLDYHIFDPTTLTFPGAAGTCYTWTDPVTNSPLSCFKQEDMQAVATQLKTELVDLVNVMQFMVNGSTNMKDIVASGNSSAATALIGSAATVLGSTLQPPPSTPVTTNVSNILSMVGNVVNLGATIATGGLVPPDLAGIVSSSGNMISAIFGGAGAYAGGFQNSGQTYLPSPQYNLSTTIGNLANAQLQQQFSIGFDTELDTVLGDWNKLSQLGPKITDSNQPLYSSPNQVAQNVSVTLLGQASQRAFYLALLPQAYSIQYYKAWGDPYPDMGIAESSSSCNRWYAASDINSATYVHYPSYVGVGIPWYVWQINSPVFPIDIYVLASPTAQHAGKSDQSFQVIDQQLANTLFDGNQLNLPIDQVFGRTGPLGSVFLDATVSKFDNYNETWLAICGGNTLDLSGNPLYTSTTMTATPSATTAGQNVVLQATVKANSGTATGSVDFREGNTILGTGTLDATGNASVTISTLAAGTHSIAAYYSDGQDGSNFLPSTSQALTVTVNVPVPDMSLSLSSGGLSVSAGTASSPMTLTVTSVSGMTGQVSFVCSGLPLGLACNFTPAQTSLPSNGTATTSFTVSETATAQAVSSIGLWKGYAGIGLFLLSVVLQFRIARGRKHIRGFVCMLALVGLSSVAVLSGCGGSGSKHPSGTTTVLVSATSGGMTRSIPMTVNVQ